MSKLSEISSTSRLSVLRRSGLLNRSGREQFGILTEHVRTILAVPVAIISIVDSDRQVFAGHCGLPEPWASRGETPLTHSFCQHVVESNEILIIHDANTHELVKENLAIGDLGVVAYLGVPVSLPTGEIAGAIAAIDSAPREWTDRDLACLKSLARVVEREISAYLSENRYRSFFTDMQDGYYVVRAVRDGAGDLCDVVFEEVNPAFERLTGISATAIVGARLSEVVPDALDEMLPAYTRVLETGEVVEHANTVSSLQGRWFENRIRKLDDDNLAAMVTDVTARKHAEIELRKTESYWRGLFEQMSEGFILGTAVRDSKGRVVDWRYREVNRAWGELVGIPVECAPGRMVRELFPGIEEEWITSVARVVESGRSTVFIQQIGAIGRTYEGHVHPLYEDNFVILFLEVTERLAMQAALENRERQLQTVIETMPIGVLLAEAPSGRIVMQNRRIVKMLGHDALIANSRDDYVVFHAKHADGKMVRPDEYPLAVITSGQAEHHSIEVCYVRPDNSEIWISIDGEAVKDTDGRLVGAVVAVADISERKAAEDVQAIINREMSHRLKNTLAMVQAIAMQTLRPVTNREPVEALEKRIQALSSAHNILFDKYWNSAPIGRLIASTLQRVVPSDRLDAEGPDIIIGPKAALSLSLVLHELATNAVKYGAFSNDIGRVDLGWSIEGTGDTAIFTLVWAEKGGPLVQEPSRKGFGSKLIQMGLIGTGGVEISYCRSGFRAEMTATLEQIQHTE